MRVLNHITVMFTQEEFLLVSSSASILIWFKI